MNEAVLTNSCLVAKEGAIRWDNHTDPICHAINNFREGFADYSANAPEDDAEASVYAEISYRPPRRVLLSWSAPAVTREGAVAALKLAKEAVENDDHDIVLPMVKAALAYLEIH